MAQRQSEIVPQGAEGRIGLGEVSDPDGSWRDEDIESTEAVVVEQPDDNPAAPPMPGGGGGMDGMY